VETSLSTTRKEVKRKMAKASKRKLLFSTVMLMVLLFSSVYAALMPKAQAAEASVQQESMAVTDNVIGVNSAKYESVSQDYRQDLLYLDVIPQENVRHTLETNDSKLDLYYTSVNGKLQRIQVLDSLGSPQMQKGLSTSSLGMSKDFLSSYQGYTGNAFYGELKSTLDAVDANTNVTAVFGNMKLSVIAQEDSTTFRWVYTINGIEAPDKCVALNYKKGFLKYFIDNWDLYKIGSTAVNVSAEQAIDIGMSRARNATWSTVLGNETLTGLKYNVAGAMVWKTVFSNSLFMDNPRDQDPFMLYPMRHIWVSFDKFYPGYVYGMNVYVWADTGEIGHSQLRFSTVGPPDDLLVTADDIVALAAADEKSGVDNEGSGVDSVESSSLWSKVVLFSGFAVVVLGGVTVYSRRKKSGSSKVSGVLLCILMVSSAMLIVAASASTASAYVTNGRAIIWGSESSGAYVAGLGESWRKTYWEVQRQRLAATYIDALFAQNGYSTSNSQGTNGTTSNKNYVLNAIYNNENNYMSVAVVDFDHGNGIQPVPISGIPSDEFHYIFEDQFGTLSGDWVDPESTADKAVYDFEIYQRTELKKHFFVLINACNSAHTDSIFGGEFTSTQGMQTGGARGMPYAWSHGTYVHPYGTTSPPSGNMSRDGYVYPDTGEFCYIGFLKGSSALLQSLDSENEGSPHPYWLWLYSFFENALMCDITVKQALDAASEAIYLDDFGGIDLHTGFDAVWPMYYIDDPEDQGPPNYDNPYWHVAPVEWAIDSQMLVYGNSNIKLYQRTLTLSATDGVSPTFTVDGRSQSTGTYRLVPKTYTIDVNDIAGYTFSHFSCKNNNYGRPADILIDSDGELKAHYDCNLAISVNCPSLGYTTPSGTQHYPKSTSAQVTATAYSGYALNYWLLDGNNAGNSPTINVYMNGPRTLQAVFTTAPSYKYVTSIYDHSQNYVSNWEWLTGASYDQQSATVYNYNAYYPGCYGWIIGTMNAQATGHVYMYASCDSGFPGHVDVYVSVNGASWSLVGSPYVSSTTASWIDCGNYPCVFNYVKFTTENYEELAVINIDAVKAAT
jgi:hypothetical protein